MNGRYSGIGPKKAISVDPSVPSKPKKMALSAPFLNASRQKFWKLKLAFLDAISFIGENLTKHNFNIFSKMYGTYFHDWSHSQVTEYRKFRCILGTLRLQGLQKVLGAFSWFLCLKTRLFAMKFRCIFWVIRLQHLQKCFGRIFTIFASKNKTVCCEVQGAFWRCSLSKLKKSSGHIFSIFESKNESHAKSDEFVLSVRNSA